MTGLIGGVLGSSTDQWVVDTFRYICGIKFFISVNPSGPGWIQLGVYGMELFH